MATTPEEREAREAKGLVACDDACPAKDVPKTLEEYRDAYRHWRSHANLAGCSHGR